MTGSCVQIMFPCISEKQWLREERERLGTDLARILGGQEGRKETRVPRRDATPAAGVAAARPV